MNSRLVSPFLMWAVVAIGAIVAYALVPREIVFDIGLAGLAFLALALVVWIAVFSWSLWVNQEAARSASGIKKLVKSGPYSLVRHPIYSADILLALGIALFFGTINILVIFAWLASVLFLWAGLEEKVLEGRFGSEYLEYKKKVPMLLPRLFGKGKRKKRGAGMD